MKPLLRGHFHQAFFFVTLGACGFLIAKAQTGRDYLALIIYSISLLLMFGISALYHRITWQNPEHRLLMKKLDHSAIYILIAGTFMPLALKGFEWNTALKLILIMWSVALFGIIQSIFFVKLPKFVSSLLYLFMGYFMVPYFPDLMDTLGSTRMWIFISGGIVYSLGALSYGLKYPKLSPTYFSYHEIFHILVCIGAIIHFLVLYSLF